jgi:hypothetical protein
MDQFRCLIVCTVIILLHGDSYLCNDINNNNNNNNNYYYNRQLQTVCHSCLFKDISRLIIAVGDIQATHDAIRQQLKRVVTASDVTEIS